LTSWSREAEALMERGLRRRIERGSRRKHGAAPRWAELAGSSGRRAVGAARRVRLCICMAAVRVGGVVWCRGERLRMGWGGVL
jgi:hypothetical protein